MNATMTSGRSKAKRAAIFGLFEPIGEGDEEPVEEIIEPNEDFETLLGVSVLFLISRE